MDSFWLNVLGHKNTRIALLILAKANFISHIGQLNSLRCSQAGRRTRSPLSPLQLILEGCCPKFKVTDSQEQKLLTDLPSVSLSHSLLKSSKFIAMDCGDEFYQLTGYKSSQWNLQTIAGLAVVNLDKTSFVQQIMFNPQWLVQALNPALDYLCTPWKALPKPKTNNLVALI